MNKEETISSSELRVALPAIERMGVDGKLALVRSGIDPNQLAARSSRVPREAFLRFWRVAENLADDPCVGLHAAEQEAPTAVNILGYLMMSSETLRQGLERVARYHRIVLGREDIVLGKGRGDLVVQLTQHATDVERYRHYVEYGAATILKWSRWVTGVTFHAREVRFRHRATCPISEYRRVFGCPVQFGARQTGFVLAKADLARRSRHTEPDIARVHMEYAERHLAEFEEHSFTRQVNRILMSELESGSPTMPNAASRLHVSVRTLQRRLAEEGTTFTEVLDSLRREMTLHYLDNPQIPLQEIAYLTGFSDQTALTRAVGRWTGMPPSDYRKEQSG